MNQYFLIGLLIFMACLIIRIYLSVEAIKKKRATGHKNYKDKMYYKYFLKYLMKDIPD
ncbi:hypothetical protein [Nonlabens ulvanivorans]|uniref:hypothetical protein n=1 Tax=Nonlabens ulvanivorans TaxID=906888 RepID=UPI003264594D